MADINLSSITGGGGVWVSKFASLTIEIPSAQTGTIATITPPNGQRVKLTSLSAQSVTLTNLTTVTVGGVDIVTSATLNSATATPNINGHIAIGYSSPSQEPITGEIDEVIELKTNIATSNITVYAYQFGDIA